MKTRLSILLGKCIIKIGKILKKDSSVTPGKYALKIDPNILGKFTLPKIVIAVTGSSGKGSISSMITNVLRNNGYNVAHNTKGSNLRYGILTLLLQNCNLKGILKNDILVYEVDERYTRDVFKDVKPNFVVISNITRDQPPRHGNYEVVFNTIKDALNKDMHIVLNGDDPLTTSFANEHSGKVSYYGICKNEYSFKSPISNSLDMVYCKKCHSKLTFNFVSFGNIGDYRCTKCSFKRPVLDYQITNIKNNVLTINNEYKIDSKNDIVYNYYNIIASFAMCSILKINSEKIIPSLETTSSFEKRYKYFNFYNRNGYLMNGKNENAPSYNQAINYVSKDKNLKTVVFGFEYISLRYPHKDLSWLYDIDFELIKNVDKFICFGKYAYDIATRINIAGIDSKKIIIKDNLNDIYDTLNKTKGNIYAILNLGNDKYFKDQLKEKNIIVD